MDYEGGPVAYNGHNGWDVGPGGLFRDQDRGVPIFAGAAGVVRQISYSYADRNTAGSPDVGNYVLIEHPDGIRSWYFHHRRNSVTVNVGDTVPAGQLIALMGSSGNSTGCHLHFSTEQYISGQWQLREPHQGSNQPLPSLWNSQLPYAGTHDLYVVDMSVTTTDAINAAPFSERWTTPVVMGANETFLNVWLHFGGKLGDTYRIEVRRPNGSLFISLDYTLPTIVWGWYHYWVWYFGVIPPSDYGTWNYKIIINGGPSVKEVNFEVGPATIYPPRFWPIAGRSFRLGPGTQQDTLRVSSLGGPVVTYSLVNPPSFVSLIQDSIVEIAPTALHPLRSQFFQAEATDGAGRTDTMWYHLVDPAACFFTDLAPPTIQCPGDIVRCGNPVATFSAVATDNCTPATVLCTPPSGSSFPVGTTIVNCVGTDAAGNKDSCQFNVTFDPDVIPPVVQCPNDTTLTKCVDNPRVNFLALVSDNCQGATLSCAPPSGTLFPLGTNVVTCIGTDGAGNKDTCQFNVTVVPDETPPVVQCPADKIDTVRISDFPPCSLRFNYSPTGLSDNCGIASFGCTPQNGSWFPVGSTVVTCTTTDVNGNSDTCSFAVTVARILGDLNGDGVFSPADVVLQLGCVFLGSGNCTFCFTDLNCDGNLTPADVVLELSAVFLGTQLNCSL